MASLLPQLFLDSGAGLTPSDGALLHFNVVGSGTDKDTYTTAVATVANANPVVANSKGVFPPIYISGSYDWVLQNKNAVQQNTGTVDEFQTTGGAAVVKNFATLAAAVADTGLVWDATASKGDALNIAERTTGNGGGAMWDVVLSSDVTENTYEVVQCTGVGTLSLVLREGQELNFRMFGCVPGVVTDASDAFWAAVTYAATINARLSGQGQTYLITGIRTEVISGDILIDDVDLRLGNDYTDQPSWDITATNIEFNNFHIDGQRSARTATEKWDEGNQATFDGNQGKSIAPDMPLVFIIQCSRFTSTNLSATGVHTISPYWVQATIFESVDTLYIDDASYAAYTSTGAGHKAFGRVTTIDCGLLPENYLVEYWLTGVYVAANRDTDDNFAQGAFGMRIVNGTVNIGDFYAEQYCSAALVSDGNVSFNADNITIVHNNAFTVSNNPAGAFFVELGKHVNVGNITVTIDARSARENSGCGLYNYVNGVAGENYGVIYDNVSLKIASGAHVDNGIFCTTNLGANFIINNISMYMLAASGKAVNLKRENDNGGRLSISSGTIEGGADIDMHDCDIQHLENIEAVGSTLNLGRASSTSGDVQLTNVIAGTATIIQPLGEVNIRGGKYANIITTGVGSNSPTSLTIDGGTKITSATLACSIVGVGGSCNISNIISEGQIGVFYVDGWNTTSVQNATLKGNSTGAIIDARAEWLCTVSDCLFARGLSNTQPNVANVTAHEGAGTAVELGNITAIYDWVTEDL